MNGQAPDPSSRSNLVIERHYVPRSAPRPSLRSSKSEGALIQSPTDSQPSPGLSSVNSHSPNAYSAGYSVSEVSSMTGSVSSMPQPLDPKRLPYNSRYLPESDSGMFSGRARYPDSTTSYNNDTDLESVSRESSESRYRGELFQPAAAPRIVQRQVRQMYGEVHPKNLPTEELPTPSSGDELETMSEASAPSFTDVPKIRPRASLRRKKLAEINSGFVSDDSASVSSQLDRDKSLPRGILKTQSTDISDAESLATSGNFRRTASGRTVRFQHNDNKARTIAKKVIDYEKLDSEDGSSVKGKRKKSSSSDPFSVVKPVGIKPARNDPKRSSGRSSHRGSQRGRQSRSSSRDRSRPSGSNSRSSSLNRDRPGSGRGRPSTQNKQPATASSKSEAKVSVKGEDVRIEMGNSKSKSVMSDLVRNAEKTDKQRIIKWCLIIGVPVVLLVIVIIVVVTLLTRGG